MQVGGPRRLEGAVTFCARAWAVRDWAVWELPAWLSAFVVTVTAVYVAAVGVATSLTTPRGADVRLFALFLAIGAVTVELTRRTSEPSGMVSDLFTVWYLPIAVLLPPAYGLVAPIPIFVLMQGRVRQTLIYRRVFSAAVVGLSYAAASFAFHSAAHTVSPAASGPPGPGTRAVIWVLIVTACAVLRWVINSSLVVTAVKGSQPDVPLRELWWSRELLYNDLTELCMGLLVTYAVANSAFLIVIAVPLVTVLQRSVRHRQLVNASRIDGKTGLLNSAAWQREARLEITRAVRTRSPLAVAIADIDHFKLVNDTYGHLAGDAVLAGLARAMTALLRDYDIVGRFGGEEFVILLPQTSAEEATGIAERLREKLAEIIVPAGAAPPDSPLRVTVSIGVATLDGSRRDLEDMLAAADAALYEAKNTGRNRVCVLADGALGA
jgi:diguanylate cyclase (GGDEF)-like protein